MANFEDTGQYYSSEEMLGESIVLSMNTGLVYDTSDVRDAKIIKKATDEFYAIAKADIESKGLCFYGWATTYTDDEGYLSWES